ncbi:hypothetical protein ABZU42_30120, partial [Micromonospora profundi]|uniref:hypothetical protein n=1 Tax=Micromonospora profundi TaxID=1420889 RepID=UPI0033B41481
RGLRGGEVLGQVVEDLVGGADTDAGLRRDLEQYPLSSARRTPIFGFRVSRNSETWTGYGVRC